MVKALISNQFVRYVIASAIALCVDYGCYLVIVKTTNITLPTAAAMAYSVGLIAAYFLIAGPVFKDGWLRGRRFLEITLFTASGLFGIFVTYFVVLAYVQLLGEGIHGSKLTAVCISFFSVYFFRRVFVFRSP